MNNNLEYRIEHMGFNHGQEDLELGLYMDDEIIGMVQYTLYDGELTIRDIIVRPEFRRQGYGSKMMKYIKNQHPDYEYKPSMKTDLGAKFVHKDVDLNEVRKIVREVLEESVIEETQTGQKDLEKFANDILKLLAEKILKDKAHVIFLTNNQNEPLTNLPLINTLMMNEDGFSEIGDFVNSTNIRIAPTSIAIRGKKSIKGELEYGGPNLYNEEYYKIWLKYKDTDLQEINELFEKDGREVTVNDIYFKLFYIFYSTLLHELQHAYDAWRSKGAAFNGQLKKSYTSAQEKANMLMQTKAGYDDMTPEEIDALNKSRIDYLNLVHEINARYAQAMQKVHLTGMDYETFDDIKKDWKDVYSDFKTYFDGWRHLSEKMKKKLIRRVAKAYQEAIENLKTAAEKYSKEDLEMVQENVDIRDVVRKILRGK